MKTVKIVKAFVLNVPVEANNDGRYAQQISFDVGTHDVEDHIADHWFVQKHTEQGISNIQIVNDPSVTAMVSKSRETLAREAEEKAAEERVKKLADALVVEAEKKAAAK